MEKLKKLPIGIQTFDTLRKDDRIYVDKTERIFDLVNDNGKCFFLSRPRRFGKSLLITTLDAYFSGKKELFRGLAIGNLEKEWRKYPVLRLDLSGVNYDCKDVLIEKLQYNLKDWCKKYDITIEQKDVSIAFGAMIKSLYHKTNSQIVLLIDEYDKPLIDTINKTSLQEELRNILHGFYANIKANDEYIRFAILTGVSHFSKLSIFSGLNNLQDISLSKKYFDICGISEKELEPNFEPYIRRLATQTNLSYADCVKKLKQYYDGYHFAENTMGIYNPFSLTNAFAQDKFGTYWVDTGTPTFLVECLKNNTYSFDKLTDTGITANKLSDIRPKDNDPRPLFYQTGYLTIKDYNELFDEYTLKYPNREVEESFLNFVLPYYFVNKSGNNFSVVDFIKDVMQGDIEAFLKKLKIFFSDVPYDMTSRYESYYQIILYILFKLMGFYIKAEYRTSNGRIDLLLQTNTDTYIIELKVNGTAQQALEQINNKQYSIPFEQNNTHLTKIGIAFNEKERNLEDWIIE
jgi:hypothetical protein